MKRIALFAALIAGITLTFALHRAPVTAQNPQVIAAKADLSGLGMYSHMLTLSRAAQTEYYGTLSPEDRSTLWRTHLAQSIVLTEGLTAKQRDFIIEVMNMAKPGLFDGSPESRAKVRALNPRMKALFTKEEAGNIFARMEAGGIRIVNKPDCGCSIVSDYCFFSDCHLGGCTSSSAGCGLMWVEECNGTCR